MYRLFACQLSFAATTLVLAFEPPTIAATDCRGTPYPYRPLASGKVLSCTYSVGPYDVVVAAVSDGAMVIKDGLAITDRRIGCSFLALTFDVMNPLQLFTGVHINQDLIWSVKIGVYVGFWVHRRF